MGGQERVSSDFEPGDNAGVRQVLHPAVTYFRERLAELTNSHRYRPAGTGSKLRKVTPLAVQKSLQHVAPDFAPSQTQIYRYYNGEAIPDIAVIFELADLFGVSPRFFLPSTTERS
ncbi:MULTISPECIES: helix-turn-helix domain-containing protein [Mycobacteriaceae]|uniref:helix-turn-helix domain-containing protein n=1 Tax=Mycobacterium sp. DBP42 TaxID=2545267 RepID=UPI000DA25B6E|nr:helix-turn-helix transcriptional regulator [Mycobacterium sp. DBP42]